MEEDLEKLAPLALQVLMVGYQQMMLDSRPVSQTRTAHPAACRLCDQAEETIQHLLVSCVFSWQVWFFLQHLHLAAVAPTMITTRFSSW